MKISPTTKDLMFVSSYIEDDELNVLVSTNIKEDERPNDPELRWVVTADPLNGTIRSIDFCLATDEGFEYPEYSPTEDQLEIFKGFVQQALAENEGNKETVSK